MVFEKVRELLVDQLDVEEDVVTMEANIQSDLGADSLDIVDLVMSLEEEFDCEIPDEEIENIKTVGDIVKYIEDHPWLPFALLIGKLALVFYLTSRIRKYSVTTARVIFLCYSVLTGIALSPLLLLYDAGSAIFVFGVVSVFFGVMAAAGLITKRDVSGFAPLILFGLLALLLMGAVNLFLGLEGFETAICFIGVAIFLGVTTYDSKKVKDYYHAFEGDAEMLEKVSIYSALNLYLDFINLFLYLLRLLGKRR